MLGNAIQVVERSIVRITFVEGKEKLGCTFRNCFQIFFFFHSQSELLPKLSAETYTILAESNFSLGGVEREGMVQDLQHFPFSHGILGDGGIRKCVGSMYRSFFGG